MRCLRCGTETNSNDSVCGLCRQKSFPSALPGIDEIRLDLIALEREFQTRISRITARIDTLRETSSVSEAAPVPPTPVLNQSSELELGLPATKDDLESSIKGDDETPSAVDLGFAADRSSILQPSIPQPGRSEAAIGQRLLLLIGVTSVVFGLLFFLKYSFDQNWIGPHGRVAMAYLAAVAFLEVGRRFIPSFRSFGLCLIGGGIASLYGATFAAYQIYDLFPSGVAFLLMIGVTTLAGMLSIVHDSKWTAIVGLIGGFLTPILLSSGNDRYLVLLSYMTILNVGILWLAARKGWSSLTHLGFVFTWALFSAWFIGKYTEDRFWVALFFINLYFLIYVLAPALSATLISNRNARLSVPLMVLNAFVPFGYSYAIIRGYTQLPATSLVSLGYSVVYIWLARRLWKAGKLDSREAAVFIGQASAFLILTVPILFSARIITIFWALQTAALFWAGSRLGNSFLKRGAWALFSVTIFKYLWFDIALRLSDQQIGVYKAGFSADMISRWLAAVFVIGLVEFTISVVRRIESEHKKESAVNPQALSALTGTLVFIFLNCEASTFFYDYWPGARLAAISILWTILSIVLMVSGFIRYSATLRKCALALFGATVFKVFLYDMAQTAAPFRIASFMVLGIVLIGASYLYHRYRDVILPPQKEEKP